MIRLSELLDATIVDQSGRKLGHVHDVRVRRTRAHDPGGPAPPYEVEGLVLGRHGLVARYGMHKADAPEPLRAGELIEWSRVTALKDGRVTVRAG